MKKFLLVAGILLVLCVGGLWVAPIFFKDDIEHAVREALQKQLRAEVIFDADRVGVSLFRDFPHLSLELQAFGLIGEGSFAGDTLLWVDAFGLSFDLMSVISGNYTLKELYLKRPKLWVQVSDSGEASYDIMLPSEAADSAVAASETEATPFSLQVNQWRIQDAELRYEDKAMQLYTHIQGLNHEGSGNFTQDLFDMRMDTDITALQVVYDGTTYLSGHSLAAAFTVEIDNLTQRYRLKENSLQLNDFLLEFAGEVNMQEELPQIDLQFSSPQTDMKSLLSLVPVGYMKDFESLQADGSLGFEGSIAGTYTEEALPAFSLMLRIQDGKISYPDLPKSIDKLEVVLKIAHPEGVLENTTIDISDLSVAIGQNTLQGQMHMKNLRNYEHEANFSVHADLEEVLQFAPQEGIDLKGRFDMDIQTAGTYDSLTSTFPTVAADMRLREGYAKHQDYDVPIERIGLHASLTNRTGRMADTELEMDQCELWIENKRFASTLLLRNLENYQWDLSLQGSLDLGKMTQIFPVEGSVIAGLLTMDIRSRGQYSDLEAERYESLYTSGTATIEGFSYGSEDIPLPFGISKARVAFTTQVLTVTHLAAKYGNTELSAQGSLSNYIGYSMREGEVLQGDLQLQSPKIVVAELLTEEEAAPATAAATPAAEPTLLPAHMDIRMGVAIDEVLYDNLSLTQVKGNFSLQHRQAKLHNLRFALLDGQVFLQGSYHTPPTEAARYDMGFQMQRLNLNKAYASIEMLQKMAPVAKDAHGLFSTNLKLKGVLDADLGPVYESIHGTGDIYLQETQLQVSQAMAQVLKLLRAQQQGNIWDLGDLRANIDIIDGHLHVKPFVVSYGAYPLTVSGKQALTGEMDYKVETQAPTRTLAAQAGIDIPTDLPIDLPEYTSIGFRIQGTYDAPKVSMASDIFATLGEEIKKAVEKALKKKATEATKKELDKAAEKAKKALKDLFGD